ncbi:MAG: outer membrane lipoprotein carrier protein LolA [Rubrivivax sp.]|nr:outer membrane lipoprotein carrier protein LolA [Rubrivivax sp.]
MTSGTRTPRTEGLHARRQLLLGAALAWAAAPALSAGFDLDALMTLLATRRAGEARFTEERQVAGFDSPLRSSGTLSFQAPDRFARHTLEPRPESMEVDGNQVLLKRGGRTRQMALDAVPELGVLVEAVRGTLGGNGVLLRRHFEARIAGNAARWTLSLTPRDAALARQVAQIHIAGAGADLRSVELQMAGGDRSLMQIEPLTAPSAGRVRP